MKDYDFNKYYDAEEVKDFIVFIGPDGEYYKVRESCNKNNGNENTLVITHYDWAKEFFKKNKEYKKLIRKKIDLLEYLTDKYGYIRYSSFPFHTYPIINIPNKAIYGTSINKKQIKSIYNLLKVKRQYLLLSEKRNLEEQIDGNVIDKMASNYYVKRIQNLKW